MLPQSGIRCRSIRAGASPPINPRVGSCKFYRQSNSNCRDERASRRFKGAAKADRALRCCYDRRRRLRRPSAASPLPRSAKEAGSGTAGVRVETCVRSTSTLLPTTATPVRVVPAGASHRHRSGPATEKPGQLQVLPIAPSSCVNAPPMVDCTQNWNDSPACTEPISASVINVFALADVATTALGGLISQSGSMQVVTFAALLWTPKPDLERPFGTRSFNVKCVLPTPETGGAAVRKPLTLIDFTGSGNGGSDLLESGAAHAAGSGPGLHMRE